MGVRLIRFPQFWEGKVPMLVCSCHAARCMEGRAADCRPYGAFDAIYTVMHFPSAAAKLMNPCGQAVHNILGTPQKAGYCRNFSFHRQTYPQAVGLWIFQNPTEEPVL